VLRQGGSPKGGQGITVQDLSVLFPILEVQGSDFGQETGYREDFFISSVSPDQHLTVPSETDTDLSFQHPS
jgi:hypothetical protein